MLDPLRSVYIMYAGPTEVSVYNTTAMAMYVYVRHRHVLEWFVPCVYACYIHWGMDYVFIILCKS